MSNFWRSKAIYMNLNELKRKHNIRWLHVSMSYHMFGNLQQLFQSNLRFKVMEGVVSLDFEDRLCNCMAKTLVDGVCAYDSMCRKSMVVYEMEYLVCTKFYIGNTSQKLKNRMGQHCDDIRRLVMSGVATYSFAKHFTKHFEKGEKVNRSEVWRITKKSHLARRPH